MNLDEKDVRLLTMLQEDGKRTIKAYANELGLSNTAVYERIRRLEREGVISRYVALVDKKKVDRGFIVFCHVKLVQHVKSNVLKFEREIVDLKEVAEVYHISGDHDYILKINVRDLPAYRDFLVNKLTALENIGSTQSSFVISEIKYSTAVNI